MRALNWAEAVGLPDTRAVNFAFDENEAAAIRRKWLAADARVPLEVLAAPYRDIGDPIDLYEDERRVRAVGGEVRLRRSPRRPEADAGGNKQSPRDGEQGRFRLGQSHSQAIVP